MPNKPPPIPPEQRDRFGGSTVLDGDEVKSRAPGDVNYDEQGQTGNTRVNTTPQRKVQDR
jgi:hypothetical protein